MYWEMDVLLYVVISALDDPWLLLVALISFGALLIALLSLFIKPSKSFRCIATVIYIGYALLSGFLLIMCFVFLDRFLNNYFCACVLAIWLAIAHICGPSPRKTVLWMPYIQEMNVLSSAV